MGTKQGLHRLRIGREDAFPALQGSDYEVTSVETRRYNCIAHAADDHKHWWDCSLPRAPGCYWPSGAIIGRSPEALMSAFATIGYRACDDGKQMSGFEKIVIYVNGYREWTHAAKQRPDGHWSSKLGLWEDIRHATVEAVECHAYGKASYYMKREMKRTEGEAA
jgi:hypothetical protein